MTFLIVLFLCVSLFYRSCGSTIYQFSVPSDCRYVPERLLANINMSDNAMLKTRALLYSRLFSE